MGRSAGLLDKPSRRDVIRLGAMAGGAVWAAPMLTSITAGAADAHSLPVCCFGPNSPKGCGLTCLIIALTDGHNWYLVFYDCKKETFVCGKAAKVPCPTTDPDVEGAWNQACKTSTCPPGLGSSIHADGTVTLTFSSTLSVYAYEAGNGACNVWGITPHRGALNNCSYLPICGKGFITFPLAPATCSPLSFPTSY